LESFQPRGRKAVRFLVAAILRGFHFAPDVMAHRLHVPKAASRFFSAHAQNDTANLAVRQQVVKGAAFQAELPLNIGSPPSALSSFPPLCIRA